MDDIFSFLDENPNQTQEISHVGEQNVDQEMVGLNISKSSRNKPKKLRSDVWKKFVKCKDENGKDLAKCSLCEKLFDGSSKMGTTHLRNHFRSCQNKRNEGGASGSGDKRAGNSVTDQQLNHLDRNHFNSCQNKINEGGASGSGDKPAGNSVTDQQLNPLDRVKMLIKQYHFDSPTPGDTDIINVYKEEKEKLRIYFEKLCCCFSLTITYDVGACYTGFMVHFIDDDWKLKQKMIGFKCIEGDQNMKVLKNVLSDFRIDNKISSIVTDGDSDIYVLSSDEGDIRFSCQGSLLSNCIRDFYNDETCPCFAIEMEKVIRYHIKKIFNYITETSSKIRTFQIVARSLGKEVTVKDTTRNEWDKICDEKFEWDKKRDKKFDFCYRLGPVEFALGLKEAFFELENMDPDFKSINLTKEQWDVITAFYQFCKEDDFGEINWGMLDDSMTANIYFPMLCRMYKKSLVLVTLNSLICGKEYLEFVREAEKCWEQSNLILAVAAVLDPRFKMDIVERWYKKIYGDECEKQFAIFKDYFNGVYDEYAEGTNNFQSSTSGSKEKKSSISFRMLDILGYPSHDHDSSQSLDSELHLYMKHVNFPLIEDFDILGCWRDNSRYFPTLAKMASDFLSIKIKVLNLAHPTFYINFNSDNVREAFMCTRNWLRN